MIRNTEKGQALVLIVVAIIGLLGMTALTVDGGIAYSDRRSAQNAADSAVLAAARAKIRGENISSSALSVAGNNGYDNNGTTNTVSVHNPPVSGEYAGNSNYIQVVIVSTVNTYFAPIVGVPAVTNRVEAVSKVNSGTPGKLYNGNAVVGLATTGCDAVYVAGNAKLQTWGGGLYSNSSDPCGMHFQGSSNTQTHEGSGGINMVAGAYQVTGNPAIDTHGEGTHGNQAQFPYPPPNLPNPVCSGNATKSGNTLSPGTVNGSFPPSGVTFLESGVYCVNGGFTMHGGNLTGQNVVIVMESGDIDWNGNAEIKLDAPNEGPFKGLLIFAPMSNTNEMKINGNSNSELTGTIWMPAADIVINGNNSQLQKTDSQIIGLHVKFSGSSDTQINAKSADQFQPASAPSIELIK